MKQIDLGNVSKILIEKYGDLDSNTAKETAFNLTCSDYASMFLKEVETSFEIDNDQDMEVLRTKLNRRDKLNEKLMLINEEKNKIIEYLESNEISELLIFYNKPLNDFLNVHLAKYNQIQYDPDYADTPEELKEKLQRNIDGLSLIKAMPNLSGLLNSEVIDSLMGNLGTDVELSQLFSGMNIPQLSEFIKPEFKDDNLINNGNDNMIKFFFQMLKANSQEMLLGRIRELEKEFESDETENNKFKEKKLGRPPVEKIEIPKPRPRGKNDKRTILTKEKTGKLFSYLFQLNCVFNDPSDMTKASFAKAIEALTGFSAGQIDEFLFCENMSSKNKDDKRKVAENIKSLINSSL